MAFPLCGLHFIMLYAMEISFKHIHVSYKKYLFPQFMAEWKRDFTMRGESFTIVPRHMLRQRIKKKTDVGKINLQKIQKNIIIVVLQHFHIDCRLVRETLCYPVRQQPPCCLFLGGASVCSCFAVLMSRQLCCFVDFASFLHTETHNRK